MTKTLIRTIEYIKQAVQDGKKTWSVKAINTLLYELSNSQKEASNLLHLLNNTSTLVCPGCGEKLLFSKGYGDGVILAVCIGGNGYCPLYYFNVTGAYTQDDIDRVYYESWKYWKRLQKDEG